VSVALPVVVNTNHGIAICATALPDKEIAPATQSASSDARLATAPH
jgi:hypothetical protein